MTEKLGLALEVVETTYQELVEISNEILDPILAPINQLISKLSDKGNGLTVDQLREYILQLQLHAFEISEIKEKAAMKSELAEAIQKETFAVKFNSFDGSAAAKDKLALVATSSETVSEIVYNLIANLLKTKLDQIHRLVDCLKSVLMSRMQEAKFMNLSAAEDPDSYKTRVQLNEANAYQAVKGH